MEFPGDVATAARNNLKGEGNDRGPWELIAVMMGMADPLKVTASIAQSWEGDGSTTWRALWVTDRHVAYAEVTAAVRDWSLTSHAQNDHGPQTTVADAWVVPHSAIRGLGVATVETWIDYERMSDLTWLVEVDRHDPVRLPLLGAPHRSRRDEVEQMVDAFRFLLGIDDTLVQREE